MGNGLPGGASSEATTGNPRPDNRQLSTDGCERAGRDTGFSANGDPGRLRRPCATSAGTNGKDIEGRGT
jgi:hypothetical protein